MEETIKCAPKIPINLLPSLNTDCIQLKDTLKKSGYKKLFYPFLTLPPPPGLHLQKFSAKTSKSTDK